MKSMLYALSLAFLAAPAAAWTTSSPLTGSSVSAFGGSVLMTTSLPTSTPHNLVMKKGKPNVPPNMRGNYRRQKEMSEMRDQMIASQTPGQDGMPIFNLFVRTKKANVSRCCDSRDYCDFYLFNLFVCLFDICFVYLFIFRF